MWLVEVALSVDAKRTLPARAMPDVRDALRLLVAEALITGLDIILMVV